MSPRPTFLALVLSLPVLAAVSGCTDMVTFARNNREAGISAYNESRYADAAGSFRSAIKQDPRDYESQYWLGQSYLQLGNYQSAIAAFRSALDTRMITYAGQDDTETPPKILEGLAQAIVKSDNSDLEVDQIEQRARVAKGTAAAQEYFVLAKISRYRQLPDMALDYYNRACIGDPTNFAYNKESGLYLQQLQQNAAAEQALRRAYAAKPDDPEVTAGLQQLGVVTGLSLRNKSDLAPPPLPRGPIPPPDWQKIRETVGGLVTGSNNNSNPNASTNTNAATPATFTPPVNTATAPRD